MPGSGSSVAGPGFGSDAAPCMIGGEGEARQKGGGGGDWAPRGTVLATGPAGAGAPLPAHLGDAWP